MGNNKTRIRTYMKEVIICVGIPASGKSTWSKQFVIDNPNYIRVCRDDYRWMLKNSPVVDKKTEELITKLVNNDIHIAFYMGFNIIIDQTNVNSRYLEQLISFCNGLQVKKLIYKVFDIEVEEAIRRDSLRPNPVGEEIINRMYQNYQSVIKNFKLEKWLKN